MNTTTSWAHRGPTVVFGSVTMKKMNS